MQLRGGLRGRLQGRGGLLRHGDFRSLLVGQSVSEVGSQVTLVALPLLAVTVLHASAFEVGLLGAAGTAAFLLVGLPAGAWLDRIRRRLVLIIADVVRTAALVSIPVAGFLGVLTMGHLYLVALASGTAMVFFEVAYQSYLPFLVGRANLIEGNAKLAVTRTSARLWAPSLAGWLVQLVGAAATFLADAISYVISLVFLARIQAREPKPERGTERNLRREISEGLRFVLAHPILRMIAVAQASSIVAFEAFLAIAVVFLVRAVGLSPGLVGTVMAASALGSAVAAVVAGRVISWIGSARAIWLARVMTVPFMLLVPLTAPGWPVVLFAVGLGVRDFGVVIYNVAAVSFRQMLCPERLLGRMNATMRALTWGMRPLGALAGGVLAAMLGLRLTLWVCIGAMVLSAVPLVASPLRTMRDAPSDTAAEPAS